MIRYDVFVAYAEADRDWVEGHLLAALDEAEVHYQRLTAEVQGLADVQRGYALHDGETEDSWDTFFAGRLPYLPAGPWTQASYVVGEALCLHNTLIEVEHHLRRERHQRTEHRKP